MKIKAKPKCPFEKTVFVAPCMTKVLNKIFVVIDKEKSNRSSPTSPPAPLNWHLSVDKNSLSISPTNKTLSEYIQTVNRQRLAGQHVSRFQAAFTGVSTEPGADERLVPSSRGHCTARYHAAISATWKYNDTTVIHLVC